MSARWRWSRTGFFAVPLLLSLRWPMPMALATLSGDGANDATVLAFVAPFFLTVGAAAGYLRGAWLGREASLLPNRARLWMQGSTSAVIVASSLTALFTGMTFMRIRETLASSFSVIWWLSPPLLTLAMAIALRYELEAGGRVRGRASQGPFDQAS